MVQQTDFQRINTKRVERIVSDLNLILKSARSQRVEPQELGGILDPIPMWFIDNQLSREPDNGETKAEAIAPKQVVRLTERSLDYREVPSLVADIPDELVGSVLTQLVARLSDMAAANRKGVI